ncbi:SDR family NAD(P)-dependent oxidoreductase [Parasphingopyxis marina]|uniref:SDR family oxidoreductase n=1 Tax=Parasphingopyxis marina TaxID=2761622 RepID=A0A842HYX5_9SPHN|nr:SDR family NAD(P)-dependent oxidoreductase [Parasphingopyxis marina]MBC2778045.1 SDR family oxidoreductase [Parasphingopyxis marina]
MARLSGKVAIVTGSGRGLGRAIAKCFAAEGAKVAIVSLTPEKIDETVAEIEATGGTALGVPCDVREAAQIVSAVERTVEAFGPVDILVNNAFAHDFPMLPLTEMTPDLIHRLVDAGPVASLHFMQACYPHMAGRYGRIINFGTALGIKGIPGLAHLAIAKEGIRALTRVAAHEWGKEKITVNAICPFAMTDGMMEMGKKFMAVAAANPDAPPPRPPETPVGRIGSAEEDIAPVALFLASPDSGYMTGYTFMADGGGAIDAAR